VACSCVVADALRKIKPLADKLGVTKDELGAVVNEVKDSSVSNQNMIGGFGNAGMSTGDVNRKLKKDKK